MTNNKIEYYLYAHNGAKYDIVIINDKLFKHQSFTINKEKFMELNGGVINETIKNEHGTVFHMRDSCRLFAGSLEGLC